MRELLHRRQVKMAMDYDKIVQELERKRKRQALALQGTEEHLEAIRRLQRAEPSEQGDLEEEVKKAAPRARK